MNVEMFLNLSNAIRLNDYVKGILEWDHIIDTINTSLVCMTPKY